MKFILNNWRPLVGAIGIAIASGSSGYLAAPRTNATAPAVPAATCSPVVHCPAIPACPRAPDLYCSSGEAKKK